ncbi:MAG: hypothetical protein UV46_C0066G0006, partial [Candidatus Gottesmanbacteria bacterium GW2011_GWC2_42_8]
RETVRRFTVHQFVQNVVWNRQKQREQEPFKLKFERYVRGIDRLFHVSPIRPEAVGCRLE